jgi:hypothetical protein
LADSTPHRPPPVDAKLFWFSQIWLDEALDLTRKNISTERERRKILGEEKNSSPKNNHLK